jgi:hypothetical protein
LYIWVKITFKRKAISDFLFSIGFLIHFMNLSQIKTFCTIEAFIIDVLSKVTLFWSFFLVFHLFLSVWINHKKIIKMEIVYHIFSWTVPLVIYFILILKKGMGINISFK